MKWYKNRKLIKCQVGEIVNKNQIKMQVDKDAGWQKIMLMKWRVNKIAILQNRKLMKMQVDNVKNWWNGC